MARATSLASLPAGAARTEERRTRWAVAAFFLLLAIITVRAIVELNVPGHPEAQRSGLQDFRDGQYYPALAFLRGENPYDPGVFQREYPVGNPFPWYLPLTLLIHAPFALLPFQVAEFAYLALLAAVVLGIAAVTLRACGLRPTTAHTFGLGALILASRPGHWSLFIGQCTPLAVLGAILALAYAHERPLVGGLGLALSAFKPTFGAPLTVFLLMRRDMRAIVIGMLVAGALSLVATGRLVGAAGGLGPFIGSLGTTHEAFSAESTVDPTLSWSRIDAVALGGRVLGHALGTPAAVLVGIVVLGLGVLAATRLRDRPDLASTAICVAVLTCTYHQSYDLLLLALPLTALVVGRQTSASNTGLRTLVLVLLLVPTFNYVTSWKVIGAFPPRGPMWFAVTSVNSALLLAVLLILCAVGLRRSA